MPCLQKLLALFCCVMMVVDDDDTIDPDSSILLCSLLKSRVEGPDFLEKLEFAQVSVPQNLAWFRNPLLKVKQWKLFRANFHDRVGQTVLILKPGLLNTTSMDNQIRHLVYLMENVMLNLPEGQEEMAD
ncbi:hypothetical protein L1987_54259 [Smallanthus sonchifolius]|uniref:Uncharacterized protein n=1 Tax=Smallanthus sonchifolius TaxID=185202 RepID=A0ACB9E745_9ASTR|nr:hypothetical protein L1987_54259 [Smallanthus sonchifolius]